MDELNLNPAWYDIKIIYRYPQEILYERINYGYMAIKKDKHVKVMFNRIQKMPQVNAAELYVSLEALQTTLLRWCNNYGFTIYNPR